MVKRYIYGGKTYTLNSLRQEFRKRDLAITDYYNNLDNYDIYTSRFNNVFNNLEMLVFDDITTYPYDISYNTTVKLRDISNNNYILNYNVMKLLELDNSASTTSPITITLPTQIKCNYNTLWLLVSNNKYNIYQITTLDSNNNTINIGYLTGGLKTNNNYFNNNNYNPNKDKLTWIHIPYNLIQNANKIVISSMRNTNLSNYNYFPYAVGLFPTPPLTSTPITDMVRDDFVPLNVSN